MDNGVGTDREKGGSTSWSTTWRTCGSTWWMWRIELSGGGDRRTRVADPSPEGFNPAWRRERGTLENQCLLVYSLLVSSSMRKYRQLILNLLSMKLLSTSHHFCCWFLAQQNMHDFSSCIQLYLGYPAVISFCYFVPSVCINSGEAKTFNILLVLSWLFFLGHSHPVCLVVSIPVVMHH